MTAFSSTINGTDLTDPMEIFNKAVIEIKFLQVDGDDENQSFIYFTTLSPDFNVTIFKELKRNKDIVAQNTINNTFVMILSNKLETINQILHFARNLKILNLNELKIERVNGNMFDSNENLEGVDLSANQIHFIEPSAFLPLTNLLTLDLSFNPLREIDPQLLAPLRNLRVLKLMQCEIKNLHPETFRNQVNLRELLLLTNHIEIIHPGTFTRLGELRLLSLSSNYIKTLNSNSFGTHLKMQELYISNNQIRRIQVNFFAGFPNLKFIEAKGNVCVDKNLIVTNELNLLAPNVFESCSRNWESLQPSPIIVFFFFMIFITFAILGYVLFLIFKTVIQ